MAASNALPGPLRILVLDDDPALSRLMAALLARAGYAVDTGKDGEEGWAALNVGRYDLLMTDNDMPRLKGLDLVRRLRHAGILLPVIVVSGSEELRAVADDDTLRLAAVMLKPFNPDDLIAQVERNCPTALSVTG
jgi:DNA-binding response OmpR family regulator